MGYRLMKVLIITPDYPPPPGGIQTLTKNLERGLNLLGHQTRILHLRPEDCVFPRDYIPRLLINHPKGIVRWPFFNLVYKKTKEIISTFSPDIVHITHILCWPALRAAKEKCVSRTATTHALELQNEYLVNSADRYVHNFHSVSCFTSGLTERVVDVKSNSVDVIPPSIPVSDSIPDPTPNGPVFCISRLDKRKNITTLIDAWKNLPKSLREKHRLIIAGDGSQRQKVEWKASKDPTIRYIGRISTQNKRNLFKKASVFALAPVRNGFDVEGFGIVYIEAQAQGTPVIGSSTGGVPEAVGNAGLLVNSPRDTNSISKAITELLTNEETRKHCYESIQKRIQYYNIESVAKEHIERYQKLI